MALIPPSSYFRAFENLNEAVFVSDGVEVIWCMQKAADLLGYSSPDDVIGKDIMSELVAQESHIEANERIERISKTLEKMGGLVKLIKKDGSVISCVGRSSLMETSNGTYYVSIVRPTESALTNEQDDHFLASVKHEINTPVTVIWGYAELIQHLYGGELRPEVMMFLDKIIDNARRLEILSKAMLKLESHQNELDA